jgi:hypothetical protein
VATDPKPLLCKNCKYFIRPLDRIIPLRYGYCKKFGEINLIDGSIHYAFASEARKNDCHGKEYEPRNKDVKDL